jgi:hypothetical protein
MKMKKEGKAYSALRRRVDKGEESASVRMQWHVNKRIAKGWRLTTIARRLGITVAEVEALAKRRPVFDSRPRLVTGTRVR